MIRIDATEAQGKPDRKRSSRRPASRFQAASVRLLLAAGALLPFIAVPGTTYAAPCEAQTCPQAPPSSECPAGYDLINGACRESNPADMLNTSIWGYKEVEEGEVELLDGIIKQMIGPRVSILALERLSQAKPGDLLKRHFKVDDQLNPYPETDSRPDLTDQYEFEMILVPDDENLGSILNVGFGKVGKRIIRPYIQQRVVIEGPIPGIGGGRWSLDKLKSMINETFPQSPDLDKWELFDSLGLAACLLSPSNSTGAEVEYTACDFGNLTAQSFGDIFLK